MKKINLFLIFAFLLLVSISCEDFVQNIEPLIDQVEDDRLDDQGQVNFLINGILTRFADTQDNITLLVGGLSDELFFDENVPNATFPTFKEIDRAEILKDNNSIGAVLDDLGELRFFADDLIRRVGEITFTDQELKREALFYGNLMGGIARYFYAAYIGLEPTRGGGTIDAGPFIESDEMYDLALQKLQSALQNASTSDGGYQQRLVNSLIARIHLYRGNYTQAATFAQNGLDQGDPPFQGLHKLGVADNYWWVQAGVGRTQFVVDWRFNDYITADPNEANRIQLGTILGNDGVTIYYMQVKYDRDTPQDFISWQENELMLAEIDIRNGDNASGLNSINKVRHSHGLDPLTSADLNTIIEERDKELFTTGARLVDERRFGIWHNTPGPWRYLRITEEEINANPNL